MSINKHKRSGPDIPATLQTIPSPPRELFVLGDTLDELLQRPRIAIVGSRKVTPYGREVTDDLARQLVQHGVVIISGLAFGVDSIAHHATLEADGQTIAVLPTSIEEIYPRSHQQLAREIVEQGGVLVSEYPDGTEPYPSNFIARNRLVAGLADAVLVTEAAEKSGTLHTVNFALEQGKPVLAVPGNITSPQSRGTNNIIKTGAIPVTDIADILVVLGISTKAQQLSLVANTPEEHTILTLLQQGISDGHELLTKSKLHAQTFNQTLSMLEISGRIKPLGNNRWKIM